MAHPKACGKDCSLCITPCELDTLIPCSPNCNGLNPETGEADSEECKVCSSVNELEE